MYILAKYCNKIFQRGGQAISDVVYRDLKVAVSFFFLRRNKRSNWFDCFFDIQGVTMFCPVGFWVFFPGMAGEQRLKGKSFNPLPLDTWRRCREIKTLAFVTAVLISFDLLNAHFSAPASNGSSFFLPNCPNCPYPPNPLTLNFSCPPPRGPPHPFSPPLSGTPVPTTTCSALMWSTANPTRANSSTSSTPATCGGCGTWFKATLRRTSSPILHHPAS